MRDGIRAEVKEEVITQAKEENWAAPNTFPEWVSRVEWSGDVRVRNESRFRANDNSDLVADYQEWNDTEYDISVPNVFPPLLNTRQDRENLLRIRARFGLEADLGKHWRTGLRLATGSSDSPVSTTQTLGGGLSKKDIWLDRAWISWHPGIWTFTAGRAKNPFVSTDILYSGSWASTASRRAGTMCPWGARRLLRHPGGLPLGYISDDFPSDEQNKKASEDKWLLGAQLGIDWRFQEDRRFLAALAYYDFNNIEGQRSSPCPSTTAIKAAARTGRRRPSCRRATAFSCCATSF